MKAALPITIGVCTALLASACSSSLSRNSSTSAPVQPPNLADSRIKMDNDMRNQGYQPMTSRGERVYCRDEVLTGSNLKSKICLTAKQIEELERSSKDIFNANRPAGCAPKQPGCI
jgi:hypothetical protein